MINYNKIKDIRNMILIKKSGLFDQNYYKKEYPEAGKKALEHYYYKGYKIGNNPSKKFDNDYYLINNSDVRATDINPLLHYIIAGKDEGRRIKKAMGISIPKLYKIMNKKDYSYSINLKNTNKKRITFFLGDSSNNLSFIFDIIEKYNKKDYIFRIIYHNSIEDSFYNLFNKKNIKIDNIEFLKWNENYLLEVYSNETFISNDYYILLSLLNTDYIKKPLYLYLDNNTDYQEEEIKYISLYIDNKYIKCIGNNIKINKYDLRINNKYNLKDKRINACIVFNKLSIPMFDIIQSNIVNNNSHFINLYYHSNDFDKDICLLNERTISYVKDYSNMDLIIKYDDNKTNDDNIITIKFTKTNEKLPTITLKELTLDEKKEILSLKNINIHLFDKEGDNNV